MQQGTPPIGATYIRVLSDSFARFPSETLYDFDNNLINVSFLTTQPIKYLYPGTIWKLAVREGDFMRQIKIDPVLGNTNFMATQSDAIRNITGNTWTLDGFGKFMKRGSVSGAFKAHLNGRANIGDGDSDDAYYLSFDASRVVPTADENRPVNTSVEMWVRIA